MMSSVQRLAILEAALSKIDEATVLVAVVAKEHALTDCEKLEFVERVSEILAQVDPGWSGNP